MYASDLQAFIGMTIEKKSLLVVLKREDDKQAQILSVIPQIVPKLFEEITLSQISKLSFRKGDLLKRDFIIRGITTLPSGKIVVADSGNNSLIIFNTDCLLDKSIRIPLSNTGYGPFDVTYVKDDLVAVSTLRAIHIVNITSEMIEEIIATNDECRGIAYTDGTLIYWLKSNGMQKTSDFKQD
ncbi:Hypothetical predicted protein [Mytilus galloprovincialis]|uniref:Uncharacterized protein n=1 Tax=Mytilus galloprovincialis TaxID=29158 RepID=A0A8B6EZA2_MYTGA|nr:Hypothetical predicted protein [Mytilus galloprovincialis]